MSRSSTSEQTGEQPREPGEELLSRGWTQGSLFQCPDLVFFESSRVPKEKASSFIPKNRAPKSVERFVLISQDCDIQARPSDEPYVEALFCVVRPEDAAKPVGRNSSRWFDADRSGRFVVGAQRRLVFPKKILLDIEPKPWPGTEDDLTAFVRWLGRRYTRPAFPNKMVTLFQNKVQDVLLTLKTEQPDVFAAFNSTVHEFRVTFLTYTEEPPFHLALTIFIHRDTSEEGLAAVQKVTANISAMVDPEAVQLAQIRTLTYDDVSVDDYFHSQPLPMDEYTFAGDDFDVEAAEPFRGP